MSAPSSFLVINCGSSSLKFAVLDPHLHLFIQEKEDQENNAAIRGAGTNEELMIAREAALLTT